MVMNRFLLSTFLAVDYATCWIFGICMDLIGGFEWRVTHDTASICFRFSFKLGISSYKMIYFLSNIYKWTPTLLTTGSSLGGICHIYILCGQPVCYTLIQYGRKP